MWKMSIYLAFGAGIQTHDLLNMNILLKPPDQSSLHFFCFMHCD